jgi:hypothetical protein
VPKDLKVPQDLEGREDLRVLVVRQDLQVLKEILGREDLKVL